MECRAKTMKRVKPQSSESLETLYKKLCNKKTVRKRATLEPLLYSYNRLQQYLLEHKYKEPLYIQVLGTNGKGSTSTYISCIAQEYNIPVGLFTSPHLVNIRERIVINEDWCTEGEWCLANSIIEEYCDIEELLFFEHIFLLAVYLFSYKKTEIAVMEAGLGGKYDATSVLFHRVQCFTPIQLDHEHILGRSIVEIAEQKAEAIQEESVVLSVEQEESVIGVLKEKAKQGIEIIPSQYSYELSLRGEHQVMNASLACKAWDYIASYCNCVYEEDKIGEALKKAYIPGRLEEIQYNETIRLLVDGAHNCGGLETLYRYCQDKKIIGVLYSTIYRESLLDTICIVKAISKESPLYYYEMDLERGVSFNRIQEYEEGFLLSRSIRETIEMICSKNSDGYIVICGSLYFLGYFLKEYPEYYYLKGENRKNPC